MEKIVDIAKKHFDYVVEMRREFHKFPEPSFEEVRTCKRICEELEKMGIPHKVVAGTGVMATIKGAKEGKTVALRADIDALTVLELNECDYKSTNEGVSHACGHDAHAATLLGAAKILMEVKDEIAGEIRLLFQPAEEIGKGALKMIEEGCLEGVDRAMGIHIWSNLPVGKVSCEVGPRMAAADFYKFKVTGKAGHGAMPHEGIDAGLASASIMMNLQSIVSREISPFIPTVVTVGKIESGTRFNVIASEANVEGTVRTFSRDVQGSVQGIMERIIKNTASAYRCEAEMLDYHILTTPCINPEAASKRAYDAVAKNFGQDAITNYDLQMGGEDYCFIMDVVPDSVLCFVGCGNPEKGADKPQHAGDFKIDEDGMLYSMTLYAQYAIDSAM